MGHKRKRKTFLLTFADGEYAGLQVRVASPPMGLITSSIALADVDFTKMGPDQIQPMMGLFDSFAMHLVDWNLEDEDGTPVPATYDGVMGEEPALVMTLMQHWLQAAFGVSDPLGEPSIGGGPSAVASIPTEPLSPNPQS